MALSLQKVGRDKVVVLLGSSLNSLQSQTPNTAFGTVSAIWWGCMDTEVGARVYFDYEGAQKVIDAPDVYYVINEKKIIFTEEEAP